MNVQSISIGGGSTSADVEDCLLPFTKTLVVVDVSGHLSSPLSHFNLNCEENGKLFIHTARDLDSDLAKYSHVPIIIEPDDEYGIKGLKVYPLKTPMRVSGDGSLSWGMVSVG